MLLSIFNQVGTILNTKVRNTDKCRDDDTPNSIFLAKASKYKAHNDLSLNNPPEPENDEYDIESARGIIKKKMAEINKAKGVPKDERHIKFFSYIDKDGNIKEITLNYGQNWSEISTDNEILNFIISSVDDGDGIIQPHELNILNKMLLYIDGLDNNPEHNAIIDNNKLEIVNQGKDPKGLLKILNAQYYSKAEKQFTLEDIFNDETVPEDVWSEGLNRTVGTIRICGDYPESNPDNWLPNVIQKDLEKAANELGITIETIPSKEDIWVEDSSIRRADGKLYVPFYDYEMNDSDGEYISDRNNVSSGGGARVAEQGNAFGLVNNPNEVYYGTSYLEGGNVINTINKDGQAAAIVGESSIGYTLAVMGLEYSPENIEIAKAQIAEDLGLNPENVTFIPQFDFHIDMLYHHFNNGQVIVPDFDAAINILKNENIPSMGEKDKQDMIELLEELKQETEAIREEAEDNLRQAGYEIVKMPFFSMDKYSQTNYMNGVCGTSPNGTKFLITNKSEFPELDKIIEPYFTGLGIEKVYFIDTQDALVMAGGVDCLTQEYK